MTQLHIICRQRSRTRGQRLLANVPVETEAMASTKPGLLSKAPSDVRRHQQGKPRCESQTALS
eukprot:4467822-Amphidinium_carterae.1